MTTSFQIKLISVYSVYFIIYLYGIITGSDLLGNIFSPLGALIAGLVLLRITLLSIHHKTMWFLATLACLSWFIGDVLWSYVDMVLGLSPEKLPIFMVIFDLPNLFIALTVGHFFYALHRNWDRNQFILDFTFTLLSLILVLWSLFMQDQLFSLYKLDTETLALFFNIFADFFALLLIYVIFISSNSDKRPRSLKILLLSISLYTISDLYYCYLAFNEAYIPNGFLDSMYMASLLLLSLAGVYALTYPLPIYEPELLQTIPSRKRFYFLLILPILLVMARGFVFKEIISLLILFLVHQVLTGYAASWSQKERHLKELEALNVNLETRIQHRTKELFDLSQEYSTLSRLDSITFLYNRQTALDLLDDAITSLLEHQRLVIYVLDLIRFRTFNSTYGHDRGDAILVGVAERIKSLGSSHYSYSRLGGDEFAIFERGYINRVEMEDTAEKICRLFDEPLLVQGGLYHLSISVGVSCYPTDATDRSSLLKNADMSMFHSKTLGLNKYTLYSTMTAGPIKRKHELEHLLKKALKNNEFHLVYQPQFELPAMRLIGMEALLRWINPEIGSIPPSEFIPIAEETGLITTIGEWVLDQSLQQIQLWNTRYHSDYKMGVNISPTQLNTVAFITHLETYLFAQAINPKWVDIEITETSTLDSEIAMEEILTALSAIGISISIDDFGTGYSSMSYIKQFDIDRLKIAKPLIDGIVEHYGDKQIVQAITDMGKALDIEVIAEGVESQDQANLLLDMGCYQIQGYLTGRPTTAEQFEKLYLDHR